MEKMKIDVGTIAAPVLVAVVVSALVVSFGMVYAPKDNPKVSFEFELEIEQNGDDVDAEVKARGLAPDETFVVRAYTSTDCAAGTLLGGSAVGSDDSDSNGNFEVSGTVSNVNVGDVNSVSIRDDTGPS